MSSRSKRPVPSGEPVVFLETYAKKYDPADRCLQIGETAASAGQ